MKLNPQIFREYDIRGVVDRDLSPEFAYLLGRAYGTLARDNAKNRIAIGRDCRLSSQPYSLALADGITKEGVDVVLTGMGPTPQLYFAVFDQQLGGGIQVTGSHNPADMNGFKILLGNQTLSGEAIRDLRMRCEQLASEGSGSHSADMRKRGTIVELPIQERYLQNLVANSKPFIGPRKLKIVVDAGNGVGGLIGPTVLRQLGMNVVELYCEPDGNFPNHHPDPTEVKNIVDLIARVKAEGADLGIGWDGDADRIGAVDERGEVVFGDILLLLYGREILKTDPGAAVIGDVKCSDRLFDDLKTRGAKPIMWKTGHSLIKGKLKETGAALAGEMSGHIFFSHRYFGFDDALYASCRLVEILSNHDGPMSSLFADLPSCVTTPEIRVDCAEELKFKISEAAQEAFPEFPVDTTDGVRIRFPKGWGLVRASNTQPILVMRFEAETQEELDSYQSLVRERLAKIERALG
jgi:phosphomannomutase / phosphoglucomutase